MKKLLSVLTVICIILTTSITAFGAKTPDAEKVKAQINGAVEFITQDVAAYKVDDASTFYMLTGSGANVDKYADGFLNDVKENLEKNNGKIVPSYGESIATYGAVILILNDLGANPRDFYGYNVEETLLSMDPTVPLTNPNYYRAVTKALAVCESDDATAFLEKVCDTYIDNYYTMGKGVDYYGYSCDNTAYFLSALSAARMFTDKYDAVTDDALSVIDTYKTDGGYCFDPQYGTQASANSTALALMAHSDYILSSSDTDGDYCCNPDDIYNELCAFEGSKTGIFTYDGDDDAYTTKEAMIALVSYRDVLISLSADNDNNNAQEETTVTETTTDSNTTTTAAASSSGTNKSDKSPATGADTAAVCAASALAFAAAAIVVIKKKSK